MQGAALASLAIVAGCARDAADKDESARVTRDGGPNAGSFAPTPDSGMPTKPGRPTEPYPLDGLGCSGEVQMGLISGQCCVRVGCYTPAAGQPCASAQTASSLRSEIPSLPSGSGTCGCKSTEGPFAPNPDDAVAQQGECCYTFGVIGCTGRPLTVRGTFVIAPLAARSDWARFA